MDDQGKPWILKHPLIGSMHVLPQSVELALTSGHPVNDLLLTPCKLIELIFAVAKA